MLYNLKFWTDMEAEVGPDGRPTGNKIPVDWVSYGPAVSKGVASNNVMVSDKVRRIDPANFQILPGQDGGMTMKMVQDRWESIEPHYRAWKDGREVHVDGTPLAAWTALRSEEVDTLLSFKITSVEAVAKMTDTQCSQLPLPNAWGLRDLAKKFLETADANKASEREEALMARIAHLESVLTGPSVKKVSPVEMSEDERRDAEIDRMTEAVSANRAPSNAELYEATKAVVEYEALVQELEARGIKYDKRVKDPDKLRAILNAGAEAA